MTESEKYLAKALELTRDALAGAQVSSERPVDSPAQTPPVPARTQNILNGLYGILFGMITESEV